MDRRFGGSDLIFLRDWRTALVVVLNIPLALLCSVLGLWISGETINVMTLGGLALAIGILVDEATVEVENIHAQMGAGLLWWCACKIRKLTNRCATPACDALCFGCIYSRLFMPGAAQRLFAPLALAVGFAMLGAYVLSSTFFPVMSMWLMRASHVTRGRVTHFDRLKGVYESFLSTVLRARWPVILCYFAVTLGSAGYLLPKLGRDIFPLVDGGQFR